MQGYYPQKPCNRLKMQTMENNELNDFTEALYNKFPRFSKLIITEVAKSIWRLASPTDDTQRLISKINEQMIRDFAADWRKDVNDEVEKGIADFKKKMLKREQNVGNVENEG